MPYGKFMELGSEILGRIFQSTGVDVARNILHYLHREIERTIFLRETDARKWLMQTTGGWRWFPHMECCRRVKSLLCHHDFTRILAPDLYIPTCQRQAFPFVIAKPRNRG